MIKDIVKELKQHIDVPKEELKRTLMCVRLSEVEKSYYHDLNALYHKYEYGCDTTKIRLLRTLR